MSLHGALDNVDGCAEYDGVEFLDHLGVKVALDDFGTGFSSLSYLCRFPITELKIDRSFVVDIRRNTTAYKVVKTIIELGQALDIRVIAEGVETPEQYNLLTEMGCDEIQGYLVSRPLGVVALQAFLDNFGGARVPTKRTGGHASVNTIPEMEHP